MRYPRSTCNSMNSLNSMQQTLLETTWLIPCYGLVGALVTLPWSIGLVKRSGSRPAAYLNILTTLLALLHGFLMFSQLWGQPEQIVLLHWFKAAGLDLTFALNISAATVGAMELVTFLSLLAQFYALGYLEKDWSLARFFGLMGFFEAAMSGLVLSDSLFLTYCLLEGLTLSTYLLVGFWYAQPLVVTAARDAFLTKRVGDVLLLMGMVVLGTMAGSLNFDDLYKWAETAQLSPLAETLLGLALIACPIGKCAQFPLNLWLDEAMEGPNPASILRNSVVVSCGAYVLIKLQPIIAMSSVAQITLLVIGSTTAIGAALVAIAQIDIKRALSHTTSSTLGLVFVAIGLQWTDVALFLLLAHAIAKALLFMSIGAVITVTTTQDLTEMGGLAKRLPATTTAFIVGSAGSIGCLPLGMFWAMHRTVVSFEHQPLFVGVLLLTNVLLGIGFVRVFRLVFWGEAQAKSRRAPEVGWSMAVPMVTLTVATLVLPWVLGRLELLPTLAQINPWAVLGVVGSGTTGVVIGALMPLTRMLARPLQPQLRFVQDLLAYDFYVDRFYQRTIVRVVGLFSAGVYWFDRYVVDGFVNLVGFTSILGGEALKYSISGRPQGYMLTILLGIGLLGAFLSWSKMGLL
jgi:NAD(P)H-quinone oxidoreductase subunit 5